MPETLTEVSLPPYGRKEETANTWSHAIGTIFSIIALAMMLEVSISNADLWQVSSASIYGFSMFTLFLASSMYHYASRPQIKAKLKTFDHCAIFLLIAGTYTPFLLVELRGSVGWTLFVVIWSLAIFGVLGKVYFADKFKKISLLFYLLMGWLIVFAGDEMLSQLSDGALSWLVAGGLTYTLGAIFYACDRIPYNHAIWHIFVLFGSICHFISIYFYVFQ